MQKYAIVFFLFSCFSTIGHSQSTYQIDVTHTFINFGVERFMVGEVTGRFNEFSGYLSYNPEDLNQTKIEVSIKTGSIDTGFEIRDGHLKSNVWLDAEKFPEINFKSKRVFLKNDQTFITGDLIIHGVKQEVTFPIVIKGPFIDPTNSKTIAITGELIVNRQDFGITFSKKMDNGHLFIGNEVKISIRALAVIVE